MEKKFLLLFFCVTLGFVASSEASYSVRVLVKRPFPTGGYDSIPDSLARGFVIRTTVFSNGGDSLFADTTTDDSGLAVFAFESWADQTPVDTSTIVRMAIAFPNTKKVVSSYSQTTFVPMVFDTVNFKVSQVNLVLPLAVTVRPFTVGDQSGFNICKAPRYFLWVGA